MKRFTIKVNGQTYPGLFAHGCDAILDALARFPEAKGASATIKKALK